MQRSNAAWTVDYLKYDWCDTGTQDARASYETMSDALRATGRQSSSVCASGGPRSHGCGRSTLGISGHTGDIWDHWQVRRPTRLACSTFSTYRQGLPTTRSRTLERSDMLEVGNGGM